METKKIDCLFKMKNHLTRLMNCKIDLSM